MRQVQSIGQIVKDSLTTSGQSTNSLPQKQSTPSLFQLSNKLSLAVRKEVTDLRIRYPTLQDFMNANTPSRQIELCHHPEQCVFGNSPTLTKLDFAFGSYSAEKWLVPQIVEVSLILGLKENATLDQTRFTASAIATLYPWLKVEELMLFFFRFKAGCYEQFYSRFDPQTLLRSLRKFMADRNYYYRIRDQMRLEAELAESRRKAVPPPKHLLNLKANDNDDNNNYKTNTYYDRQRD